MGGWSHKGYKYQWPNSGLAGEQLTDCSLPLKTQNKEAPSRIPTKEVPLLFRNASSTNTCINNCTQIPRCQAKWLGDFMPDTDQHQQKQRIQGLP